MSRKQEKIKAEQSPVVRPIVSLPATTLDAPAEESNQDFSAAIDSRSGHDFSRVSVQSNTSSAAAPERPDFNPEFIVHDLRRAIDQSQITVKRRDFWSQDVGREVNATLVIRVLDNLSPSEISKVKALYQAQEGRTLDKDLFGEGESGVKSLLKPDDEGRIRALLKGTRQDTASREATDARLEADAIELHQLLSGDLNEAKRERLMMLHRRPLAEIDRIEDLYILHYWQRLPDVVWDKLKGLQRNRYEELRVGDWAKADACAIEDKRRAIDELNLQFVTPYNHEEIEKKRNKLIGGIEAVIEQNRQEALADPQNANKSADAAVQQRVSAVLDTPGSKEGQSLGDMLATTLGPSKSAGISAMARGSLVEEAAQRLLEMEKSETTSTKKIEPLMRGLRVQAEHDVLSMAQDPWVTPDEKLQILANPQAVIDNKAKAYETAFVDEYERIRGDARSWSAIVASAADYNRDLLKALKDGGGVITDPFIELDIAIRKKDVDGIKSVLQRQPDKAAIDKLSARYESERGVSLREALFGAFGDYATTVIPSMLPPPLLKGRSAAAAQEALDKPAIMGGIEEVDWIVKHGVRERDVTEANSGFMGTMREIGDDPETQVLMNESTKRLRQLQAEWKASDPWGDGRPRRQILAEMRRVRATLTGDATAYEEENEKMVAELRSAVSFAVQIALAVALPGVGSTFVASMALNIGANVAANMIVWGDQYSLTNFRNDVLGGMASGLGSMYAEAALVELASHVSGTAAIATVQAAERAGFKIALAREAGNIFGGAAGTTLATQQNQFTFEGLTETFFLNMLGKTRGALGAHGERTAAPESVTTPEHTAMPPSPDQAPAASHAAAAPVTPASTTATPSVPNAATPPKRMVVIDADVLSQIHRGNAEAAAALKQLAQNGEVFISQQAYNEAVVNRTRVDMATANKMILDQLGIRIAPPGAFEDRVNVYARDASRGREGHGILQPSDVLTAAQAQAVGAEVWSFDRGYRNNRRQVENDLQVRVAPETSSIKPQPGKTNEDYHVGLDLLGLPAVEISPTGTVMPKPGAVETNAEPDIRMQLHEAIDATIEALDQFFPAETTPTEIESKTALQEIEKAARDQYKQIVKEGRIDGIEGISEDAFVQKILSDAGTHIRISGEKGIQRTGLIAALMHPGNERIAAVIKGDVRAIDSLIIEHGNWKQLLGMLEQGTPEMRVAAEKLVEQRKSLLPELEKEFHAKPISGSTTEKISDIDLSTYGDNAGQDLIAAEKYMAQRYGAGWSEALRMNFYTDAGRLTMYTKVMPHLSASEQAALLSHASGDAERLNLAKMVAHAEGNAAQMAEVQAYASKIGVDLNDPQIQGLVPKLKGHGDAATRDTVLLEIDDLVKKFKAAPPGSQEQVDLAKKISAKQMEANALTVEAYIGPGAGRMTVDKVRVVGQEAYQAALSNLEMIQHVLHECRGDIVTASREYELYKYINRFAEAAESAGVKHPALNYWKNFSGFISKNERGGTSSAAHVGDRRVGPKEIKDPKTGATKGYVDSPVLADPEIGIVTDEFLIDQYKAWSLFSQQALVDLKKISEKK